PRQDDAQLLPPGGTISVEEAARRDPNLKREIKEYESRIQPAPYQRAMDAASDFTMRAINSAALGIPFATLPGGEQAYSETDSTAGRIGDFAGLIVPGAAAYKTAGGAAERALVSRLPSANKLSREAVR